MKKNSLFTAFDEQKRCEAYVEDTSAGELTDPHPLCELAVNDLQDYLKSQQEWKHNFGLDPTDASHRIPKMFGVLVVSTEEGALGYLSAFSGKLADSNHHSKFVPPVFDSLEEGGFLNVGMEKLAKLNQEVRELTRTDFGKHAAQIKLLKDTRKALSNHLQDQLFDAYHFLNSKGESKGLLELFSKVDLKKPPAGAGECAAPKLLQYAYQHAMKPIALTEFWWGESAKYHRWKHGHYYAPCKEKCAPILAHMLT